MKTPWEEAARVAEKVLILLSPWTDVAEVAGSIRRRVPEVKDIEIVAIPSTVRHGLFGEDTSSVAEIQETARRWGRVTKCGGKYIQVEDVLGSGITLDLFLVTPPAEWGTIFAIRTGPAEYSHLAVSRIKGRLWRCEGGRITDREGNHFPTPTEEKFFEAAQLPCLPPEERGL